MRAPGKGLCSLLWKAKKMSYTPDNQAIREPLADLIENIEKVTACLNERIRSYREGEFTDWTCEGGDEH